MDFKIIIFLITIIFIFIYFNKKQKGGQTNIKSDLFLDMFEIKQNMYEYIALHEANVDINTRLNILQNFRFI